jgi:Mn-dependent DtxR family transcriptional regulator
MEDYLECISDILGSQGFVRVADVAERLDVARASVSVMVRRLAKLGYLDYIKYRGFRLTPAGEKLAARIRSRHATLQEFFSLLGLAPAALEKDVEGIEHHISDQTLIVLQRFNQFFRQRPELLEALH